MDDINKFIADVKRLEKSLFGLILSSFLFSLIAVLVQPSSANIQFKALTELVGGIMGSAGVLSAYLGSLRHPKDDTSYLLDFEPVALGARAALGLMLTLLMFYLFYRFAKELSEVCFVFLSIGMFMFFRTIAGAAQTIKRAELQRAIWFRLSENKRNEWFNKRNALKKSLDEISELNRQVEDFVNDSKKSIQQSKRDERRDAWQARLSAISKSWRNLRFALGGKRLLTAKEQTRLAMEEIEGKKIWEEFEADLHRKNVQGIRSGNVRPQRLEGLANIEVFNVEGVQYYFFMPLETTLETVQRFAQLVPTLKGLVALDNIEVLAIVPSDGTVTIEARSELSKYGIGIVEEKPKPSMPS